MTRLFSNQLSRMLVFGATGHIGQPLARWTRNRYPDLALRLATSRAEQAAQLRAQFPDAEVAVCSYYEPDQPIGNPPTCLAIRRARRYAQRAHDSDEPIMQSCVDWRAAGPPKVTAKPLRSPSVNSRMP